MLYLIFLESIGQNDAILKGGISKEVLKVQNLRACGAISLEKGPIPISLILVGFEDRSMDLTGSASPPGRKTKNH